MTKTTKQPAEKRTADWPALLADAVNKPGVLSSAYSVFHNYSLGNQMLAWEQLASRGLPLTPLGTFKKWTDLGRKVIKGQKAIHLYMPITITKKAEQEGEDDTSFTAFACRPNWFALCQTEGQDFQHEAKTPEWDAALALQNLGISEVRFDYPNGNCQGYASGKTIAINPVAALPHKTRFHELAHVVLGHTVEHHMADSETTPRDIREAEAEGTAYILCSVLGLPGLEESRGYIQSWLSGAEIGDKSAKRIFSAADKIMKAGQPEQKEQA